MNNKEISKTILVFGKVNLFSNEETDTKVDAQFYEVQSYIVKSDTIIPRVGEYVYIDGTYHKVLYVFHNYNENNSIKIHEISVGLDLDIE